MTKKCKCVRLKNYKKKIKSPFMIYADCEGVVVVVVPKDDIKQNLEESYTSKYQKHSGCSYGYKLVCFVISLVNLLRET